VEKIDNSKIYKNKVTSIRLEEGKKANSILEYQILRQQLGKFL